MRARTLHAFFICFCFYFIFIFILFLFCLFYFTSMLSIYRDFLCTTYVQTTYCHSSHMYIIYLACIFTFLTNWKFSQILCIFYPNTTYTWYLLYLHIHMYVCANLVIFKNEFIQFLLCRFFTQLRFAVKVIICCTTNLQNFGF